MTAWNDRHTAILLLVLLVGSRLVMYEVTHFTNDDAFITYRYAQNLSEGKGFVYNNAERVQGTSTPLFTFLLAGVSFLVGPSAIPAASRIVSLIADAVSLLTLLRIVDHRWGVARFVVGALFALFPKAVFLCTSGMETSVVVMLMLLSFHALQQDSFHVAFMQFSLLLLTRIDGILWVIVCVLALWWQRKAVPRAAPVVFILAYGLWLAFSRIYFGSVVPHAITAKIVSWQHLFTGVDPMRIFLGYFPFRGFRGMPGFVHWLAVALFLTPVVISTIAAYRLKSPLIVFPVFFILYNTAFSLGRVVMSDSYYLPGFLGYFVTLGIFLSSLAPRATKRDWRDSFGSVLRLGTVPVLAIALWTGMMRWAKDPGEWFQNEHVRLGEWFRDHAPKNASILLEPIGYIGWASKLYIHDVVGLVSSRVLEYRERYPLSDRWFIEYVMEVRPTYIVLHSWEVPTNTLFLGYGTQLFPDQSLRGWFMRSYVRLSPASKGATGETHDFVVYELRTDQDPTSGFQ